MNNSNEYAFKIVCLNENNPIEYMILDETNKSDINEVCKYLQENYKKFDMSNCKWIILPISKK